MNGALCIDHFFPFEPTASQLEVMDSLSRFTASRADHPLYLLRGYAGTGKSSLVGAYTRALAAHGIPFRLLAPTGRAAKVLEGYCGAPAATIHKAIFRERVVDGASAFELAYNKDPYGTVYIVDEASMISNVSEGFAPFGTGRLLDDLTDYAFAVSGARLLIIGDDAQLPPVGLHLSPAMSPEYLSRYTNDMYVGVMTEIVRQDDAGEIVALGARIREQILRAEQGTMPALPLLPMPDTEGEVTVVSGYDLPDLLERSLRTAGQEETVLITRSNRDAEEYNRRIRHATLYYEDEVIAGEQLMVVRNNYFSLPMDREGKPTGTFIANGELLKVLGTSRARELYGFTFRDAEFEDSAGHFVSGKLIMDGIYNGSPALTPEQRQALYDGVIEDYSSVHTKRELTQQLRKDPYLNALQVKYAYAMTCHKAQGGQWRDVYLSIGYLTPDMVDLSFCRWLYTAVTRATRHLYIINPPSFIFG